MQQRYVIQGRPVSMPSIVRDASSASVVYLVPAAVAQRHVGDAYEVVEVLPGQTQLIVGFVDYKDNDLGDYDEVMLVFMVQPRGAPQSSRGTFIWKLPVNQSFSCEAGRTIWGFPKTVEEINVDYGPRRVSCRLVMGGKHVFTLGVPRGAADAGKSPEMEMTTYTYLDGPACLQFATGGTGTTLTPGGEGVELLLGDHPIADDLRALGLPSTPMLCTWIEHMRGSFGAPRKLAVELPIDAATRAANDDAEFRIAARFWTADLRLASGERAWVLRLRDGRIDAVAPGESASDAGVAAPSEVWREMLAPVPRPFFQDLYGASVHHGLRFDNPDALWPYYPALRRLVELLRAASR